MPVKNVIVQPHGRSHLQTWAHNGMNMLLEAKALSAFFFPRKNLNVSFAARSGSVLLTGKYFFVVLFFKNKKIE